MWRKETIWSVIRIIFTLLLFLFSIDLMGEAFKNLGINVAESIIFATSNPYIGLFIGLLITAIIQSSSTSTSMIVALVASNAITIPEAIPMILGANIGTTLTSTIVSLGFITQMNTFRKALSAAVLHDFFNLFTVIVLFPLEINYGILSSASVAISEMIIPSGIIIDDNFNLYWGISMSSWLIETVGNSFILLIISFFLLFIAIKYLASNLSDLLIGNSKNRIKKYFFKNPAKSFTWGTIITAAVQSSSITTSLVVPLVATGNVKLKNAAPFIMGANIGTTITAFIAALFNSNAAISIAIAHLLINLTGVLLFLPIPFLRRFLIYISAAFGKLVINYRLVGLVYVMILFFIAPFTLIYFNKDNNVDLNELTYERIDYKSNEKSIFNILNKRINNKRYDQWLVFNDGPGYERETPNEIYNIYKNNNVLFINDNYYFLNKEGFCWESKGSQGDHEICIEKIYSEYKLGNQMTFDSVFVFNKRIFNTKNSNSFTVKEFIDVNDKLLLIRRRYDQNGELLYQEKLIETKEL